MTNQNSENIDHNIYQNSQNIDHNIPITYQPRILTLKKLAANLATNLATNLASCRQQTKLAPALTYQITQQTYRKSSNNIKSHFY